MLLEIVRAFSGYNNGNIAISTRTLADRLNTQNHGSISKALADLLSHGLIDVTAEGQWKARMARLYRLTFISSGPAGRTPATEEYRQWKPDEKDFGAEHASAKTPKSAEDVSADYKNAAEDVSAKIAQHRRKSAIAVNPPAEDVSALIYNHTPAAKKQAPRVWPLTGDPPVDGLRSELERIRKSGGARLLHAFVEKNGCDREDVLGFIRTGQGLAVPVIERLQAAVAEREIVKRRTPQTMEAL